MTNLLVFVRNIVLAAIMAWFGVEFSAAKDDAGDHPQPERSAPDGGARR